MNPKDIACNLHLATTEKSSKVFGGFFMHKRILYINL